MKLHSSRRTSLLVSSVACLLGLTSSSFAENPVVQAANYPLAYFAERIGGDAFDVNLPVESDGDPAFWKPGDEALLALQRADVILLNGATYEKWLKTVTLPQSSMVDTSKSFSDRFMESKGEVHRHGNGEVHSHAGTAHTTWIDLSQAASQADAIATRFKELKPEAAESVEKNLAALKSDLAAIDARLKAFGEAWGDKPLVASHPIYQYFARAYGLDIDALEWEPEMEIGTKEASAMKHLLSHHPAGWIIWEDTPTEENVAAVKELGLNSVVFAPGANRPESGDWLDLMEKNIANLEAMLQEQ